MSGDRTSSALERIDRAIARIGAVAAIPPADTAQDDALMARHAALRAQVEDAITAIDAIIAEEQD